MKSNFGTAMVLGQIAALGGFDPFSNGNSGSWDDPLDKIDIEAEYELIQRKKSKLSASMRKMVVSRYESNVNGSLSRE